MLYWPELIIPLDAILNCDEGNSCPCVRCREHLARTHRIQWHDLVLVNIMLYLLGRSDWLVMGPNPSESFVFVSKIS